MSWSYVAPLRDMRFVIEQVLRAPAAWTDCPGHAELDADTAAAVLEQAARFAGDVLQPLDAAGDHAGCALAADGSVTTPPGFAAAYREFVAAGWPALAAPPEWGGQGLPLLVDCALREMVDACNHAWAMYPDLLHGAVETLAAHGSDMLKARYLPRLVSGEWLAAMALTEPQAGSDLGLLRTRAEPQADGSVRVSGSKIFISGGDHDLSDNIVHLVLCRLPDAGPGTRGLSLALVPKILPDGGRNAVHCDGVEKKMGIKGSATCAMRYDGATGWLIGQPGRGLAAMFVMMNSARLHVALQGLGHAEMAAQNALRYAFERRQMRAPGGAAEGADPIALHPAMRHVLLGLQAQVEAGRVVAYRAALALDLAAHHPDADTRAAAAARAALLTPLLKASLTRLGFDGASAALQVFGGYGYVHEYGIEQTLRDARIAMIYEGTNEIQAIDLVQRKLLGDGGAAFAALLAECRVEAAACTADARLVVYASVLTRVCDQAERGAAALAALAADHADDAVLARAGDFLAGAWQLLQAWAFAASARAALAVRDEDPRWADAKLARMRYGVDWLLPPADIHWRTIADPTIDLPELTP